MRDAERPVNPDPENKCPVSQIEMNVERVLNLLPKTNLEHTGDCIQISYGGEEGIVVLVSPEEIELRLPIIKWNDPHCPTLSSKFWKKVNVNKVTDIELEALLKEALKERQSEFRKCRYCKNSLPPERMHNNDVCQGCAEKHLGVIH